MKSTLKSFASFAETRKQILADKAKLEAAGKREANGKRFAELLAEFEVSDIRELDEEKRTSFLAALLGETEELETEGNAFGAAVKKAKEEGEDEFEVGGETYKVTEKVNIPDLKYQIPLSIENIGISPKAFKSLKKAGKNIKVVLSSYFGVAQMQAVLDDVNANLGTKLKMLEGGPRDGSNAEYTIHESVVTEAKALKVGDKGVDYDDQIIKVIKIGPWNVVSKLFKKEVGDNPEDWGFEEGPGKFYFGEVIESDEEGGVGTFGIYPVKYDYSEYWGLEPIAESITEKKSLNEALQLGNKRAAKKVVTQLNRIFTKQLPDLQQMGKEGIYGCVKYFLDYSMTDANFHTEKPAVVKTVRKANIPGIEVKLPGLGGYHAKISGGRIKEILHQYAGQISKAAGWSGQGIVEGCALYLSQFHGDDATANAMINAFNSQFEGEAIRVDVSKKTKALNESFDIFEAEVKDDESFMEYVKSVYSEAFGEDYDEDKATKAAEGMLKKADGDYGAAVGMVKASIG